MAGGAVGAVAGGYVFRWLQATGQIDTVVGMLYVVLLGSIGLLMAKEAARSIAVMRGAAPPPAAPRRHHPLIAALPMRWRFYRSGLYISPLAPLLLGFGTGLLTVLLGVGGGFVLVPAMIYLLGMSTRVVVGTSLFQILFVTAATTLVHAADHQGGGYRAGRAAADRQRRPARRSARASPQRVRPEWLRLALAGIVLAVAMRMALGLGWRPDEIYTVQAL